MWDKSNTDFDRLTDWDYAKDRIYPRLANTKAFKNYLDVTIHKDIFDMSIVFFATREYETTDTHKSYEIVMMTDKYTDTWGKSFDEIYEVALENLNKCEDMSIMQCKEMNNMLHERLDSVVESVANKAQELFPDWGDNSKILADLKKSMDQVAEYKFFSVDLVNMPCGSSIMLSKDMLSGIADKVDDSFFFVPVFLSSLFCIRRDVDMDLQFDPLNTKEHLQESTAEFLQFYAERLLEKNKEIRTKEEGKQEYVSTQVFLFDKDDGCIKIIDTPKK